MSASLLPTPVSGPGLEVELMEPAPDSATLAQESDGESMSWRGVSQLEWMAALVITVVAIALHVRFVTHVGGLWRDETNSVQLAALPKLTEVLRFLDYDSFPIVFFAVLRGWFGVFGSDNDVALRALGCITGLTVLGAVWWNARAFGIRWPVLSLALVGLNPMIIRYGDSTRAYGLGILFLLLTFRSFWRLVDSASPPSAKRVAISAALSLVCVQSLYYNSVLLFAIAAGTIAVAARRRAWKTVGLVFGVGLLAALSLLPYVPMMRRMRDWTFMVSYPADLPWLWKRVCEVLGSPDPLGIWLWLGLLFAGLGLVASFAAARLWRAFTRRPGKAENSDADQTRGVPDSVLFAATALAVGIIGYAAFLRSLHYYTQPWYYITLVVFAACALEIIFGAWLANRTNRTLSAFLGHGRLVAGLALLCFTALPDWEEMPTRHTNVDLLAEQLRPLAVSGDVILVPRWECAIPLARYYHGPGEIITLPPITDHRFHRYDLVLQQMMTPDPLRLLFARLEETLHSGHRVFLAGTLPFPPADQALPNPPPGYRDASGKWHGGNFLTAWNLQVGQFLAIHAARGGFTRIPTPGNARVQEFENLELGVMEGWR